jgi:hypothetical protein
MIVYIDIAKEMPQKPDGIPLHYFDDEEIKDSPVSKIKFLIKAANITKIYRKNVNYVNNVTCKLKKEGKKTIKKPLVYVDDTVRTLLQTKKKTRR